MDYRIKHLRNKLVAASAILFAVIFCMNYTTGPAVGGVARTGAPFDGGTCATCHGGGTFAPTITLSLLSGTTTVTSYTPGASYTVQIAMTTSSTATHKYGFQITCATSTGTDINNWGALPTSTHNTLLSSHHYVEQSTQLSGGTISIPWTAPAAGTGTVKFYTCGNVVNNNGADNGDNPIATNLSVTETIPCVAPTLSSTVTNILCFGSTSGAVVLTATGGTTPITYLWSGPAGYTATTQNISGLAPGTYTIVATATGGCTSTTTATITAPSSAVSATATASGSVCPGGDATLTGSGSGGTGSISYVWAGPAGYSSTLSSPAISSITAAQAGTYTLTVSDANGCATTATADVIVFPAPTVSLGPDTATCPGTSIILDAGNAGDTFLWSNGDTTQTISISDSGTYSVTVTNSDGCIDSDAIYIALHCPDTTADTTTAVVVTNKDNTMRVYPTPANTFVTLQSADVALLHITLFDVQGNNVYDKAVNAKEIKVNTSLLATGIYTAHIKNSNGTTIIKKIEVVR